MLLLFQDGGGQAGGAPTVFPLDVGYATGLQSVDAVIHHRAPHRRAMWANRPLGRLLVSLDGWPGVR